MRGGSGSGSWFQVWGFAPRSSAPARSRGYRAKREHATRFGGHLSESQGQNLALTVLYVPYSIDSGGVPCFSEITSSQDSTVGLCLGPCSGPRGGILSGGRSTPAFPMSEATRKTERGVEEAELGASQPQECVPKNLQILEPIPTLNPKSVGSLHQHSHTSIFGNI